MARSVEYLTLDFGSGYDLRVLGSALSRESASGFSLPLSLPQHMRTHAHTRVRLLSLTLSLK